MAARSAPSLADWPPGEREEGGEGEGRSPETGNVCAVSRLRAKCPWEAAGASVSVIELRLSAAVSQPYRCFLCLQRTAANTLITSKVFLQSFTEFNLDISLRGSWPSCSSTSGNRRYLVRFDDLSPLHVDQLTHGVLDGVKRVPVAGCVETVCVRLSDRRGGTKTTRSFTFTAKQMQLSSGASDEPDLRAELDEDHVLVGGGISDDFHVLHHVVERRHELHEVVAGHGGGHGEDAHHGAASHVVRQRRHLAARGERGAKLWSRPERYDLSHISKMSLEGKSRLGSLGLVQVHDAVHDLHRGVPAEEGDVIRQLLGRRVGGGACRITGVPRAFGVLRDISERLLR